MKKLLALSIALLSLNLYGAEKPIPSKHGLEGWGKKDGVEIVMFQRRLELQPPIDYDGIKKQVELKLLLGKIKIKDRDKKAVEKDIKSGSMSDWLLVNIMPITEGKVVRMYRINIEAKRKMFFEYNGKRYACDSASNKIAQVTWVHQAEKDLIPIVEKIMDSFLVDYLKANPKK
jgi:hypothetical protein